MTDHLGHDGSQGPVEAQTQHSGVRGFELPVEKYGTPLADAPVDQLGADASTLLPETRPEGMSDAHWRDTQELHALKEKVAREARTREANPRKSRRGLGIVAGVATVAVLGGGVFAARSLAGSSDEPRTQKPPGIGGPSNPGPSTSPQTTPETTVPTTPESIMPTFTLDKAATPFVVTEAYTELTSQNERDTWLQGMSSPISSEFLNYFADINTSLRGEVYDSSDDAANLLNSVTNYDDVEDKTAILDDARERLDFMGTFYSQDLKLPAATDKKLIADLPEGFAGEASQQTNETTLIKDMMLPNNLSPVADTIVLRAIQSGKYSPEDMSDLINEMAGYGSLLSPEGKFHKTTEANVKRYENWQTDFAAGKKINYPAFTDEQLMAMAGTDQIVEAHILKNAAYHIDPTTLNPEIGSLESNEVAIVFTYKNGSHEVKIERVLPSPGKVVDGKTPAMLQPTNALAARF